MFVDNYFITIRRKVGIRRLIMLEGRYLFFGDDLTDARRIRYEVFEKEQKVPHEIEFDNLDDEAIHVVVYEDQKPVGTGRLLFDGENYKIGRIAVIKEERGKKYGDFVVRMLIDKAFLMGAKRVYANVQLHSEKFYETIGFTRENNNIFFEAGIEHVKMSITQKELCKPCKNMK
jgi:predicted GNAT family N-acyltransferase